VADYDHRNFSVSRAVVPSRHTASQILAINPTGKEVGNHGSGSAGKQLSTATLAGIFVGGIVALVVIIAASLLIRKAFFGYRTTTDSDDTQKLFAAKRYSGKSLRLKNRVEVNAVDSELHEANGRSERLRELDGDVGGPKYPPRIMRDRRSVFVELAAPVHRQSKEEDASPKKCLKPINSYDRRLYIRFFALQLSTRSSYLYS
jgi:hypothetical protein